MSWYWKGDLKLTDDNEKAWFLYDEKDSQRIEAEYQKDKNGELKFDETYKIDFSRMIQHRQEDGDRPIKRLEPKPSKKRKLNETNTSTAKKNKTDEKTEEKKEQVEMKTNDIPTRIKAAWDRIEKHLQKIKSPVLATLNPPATEEDLIAFEKRLGRKIPQDLRCCYLIHNGQSTKVGEFAGPLGLLDIASKGCVLDKISNWQIHKEQLDAEFENIARGISDDEEIEEETEEEILTEIKNEEAKQKPAKKKKENEDEEIGDEEEEKDDGEQEEEGDGNRICAGWVIFSSSSIEEESGGFLIAFAPNKKRKPKTFLRTKLQNKRLKYTQVVEWNHQYETLAEKKPKGRFVDWFEGVANKIETLEEGHADEMLKEQRGRR